MLYLSLLCFALLGFLVVYIIKNRWARLIFAFLFECLFFLEIMAIFTKKSHVDYPFIANIDIGAIKMMFTAFFKQTIIFIVFIILFNYFGMKLLRHCDKKLKEVKMKYITAILILLFGVNITKFGVINSFYRLSTEVFSFSEDNNIDENLKVLGINPKDYILKDEIVAEPGKNIVIIYLESLEKKFFR